MQEGLRVRLLGPFEVEGVDLQQVRSRKARTLAKVLALAGGRPVTVDRLVEILWGDEAPAQPEREVAVNASRIRSIVGADRLVRSDGGYQLLTGWSDVEALAELATEARRRLGSGDAVAARATATAALALARGPLLADESDPWWAESERSVIERQVADVRHVAAEAALAAGDAAEAAMLAEDALDHDGYDEVALRTLMRAHIVARRPGSALAAYAGVRERLIEDLGANLSPETEDLHASILRDEPVPVATSAPVASSMPTALLVGRDREIDLLDAAVGRAGRASEVVVVQSEPGGGKSRLLEVWAERMGARGLPVLIGRCDDLGRSLPLQPLADALTSHLHAIGRTAAADLLGDDETTLAPLLGSLDSSTAGVPAAAGQPAVIQASAFAALLSVLDRVGKAAGQPTVLVIDDAHLAGESTVAWLQFLDRRREQAHVLVVAATRAGEGPVLPATMTITLPPFDLAAAVALVGAERAPLLLERSGGNPLLFAELAAVEGGAELPDSVRATVAARVEGMGDAATALRTAAVLGSEIDLDLLAGVLGRPPIDVLDELEEGVRRSLLAESGSRFVFRHALVQEALAADATAGRRALVHREAARLLSARTDHEPLELAFHARLSGDRMLASAALVSAAEQVAARYDLDAAMRLLDEAIDLDDSFEARLTRSHIRIRSNDLDGADDDAVVALGQGGGARALELRAWIARYRHDMDTAIRLGEEGARQATDVRVWASCQLAVSFAHRGKGELVAADELLAELQPVESDVHLGLPAWLGALRVYQGRTRDALDLLDPAVGTELDSLHGFGVEHLLQMSAHAHAMAGQPAAALALIDRYDRETVRRGSDKRYAGGGDNYRSWILVNLGDPTALEHCERSVEIGAQLEVRVQALLDRAAVHLRGGSVGSAAADLDAAESMWATRWFQNRWRCEQRALLGRTVLALAGRDFDTAESTATELVQMAGARGDQRYAVQGRLLTAIARARRGDRIDPATIEPDIDVLPSVAGLEAWWLTAAVADALDVDQWQGLAEQRAEQLARECGDRADSFRTHAAKWFAAPTLVL